MIDICPTILTDEQELYRQQMHKVAHFARRLHLDFTDGTLAPTVSLPVADMWWPGGVRADIHSMAKRPFDHLEAMIALAPQLIIVHAEADGDFAAFAEEVHHHGIEAGIALLPDTSVADIAEGLEFIDHVLIFSGKFGYFGGAADLSQLDKVQELKKLKPRIEIGWDGGVSDQNAKQLADGGVQVLNSGGFIQKADNPEHAYATLEAIVNP
jgi:ribulose-phosphate 3-epimerase